MTTEDMKSMFYGQAVHKVTNLSTNREDNELFFGYNYEEDKPVTYEEAKAMKPDDPKHLDIIYGSADDLIEVDGELVIVDKKTTGSIDYFSRVDFSVLNKCRFSQYFVVILRIKATS